MGRATAIVVLAAAFTLGLGLSAFAQEVPPEEETETPETVDISLPTVIGEKVEIQLRPGEILTGVVKGRRVEIQRGAQYVPAENRDIPGAGIRIYYAFGLNGYLFVPYSTVKEIKFLGRLTDEESERISRMLVEEMRKAKTDQARVVEELAAKKAARKAKESGEEDEGEAEDVGGAADSGSTPVNTTRPAPSGVSAEEKQVRAKEIKMLLKRFPPGEWKPSRLDEIKKRAIILDIYPSEEEREFMDKYDLWLEGYEIWVRSNGDK